MCGQNCTFLLQSNGTVLAVGEGQYGRLGQGNSDDLYVPTIISVFQGKVFPKGVRTSRRWSAFESLCFGFLLGVFCPQEIGRKTSFLVVLQLDVFACN